MTSTRTIRKACLYLSNKGKSGVRSGGVGQESGRDAKMGHRTFAKSVAVKNGFENEHHRGQTCSSALGPMRESRCQLQRSGLSGFDVVDGVPTRG